MKFLYMTNYPGPDIYPDARKFALWRFEPDIDGSSGGTYEDFFTTFVNDGFEHVDASLISMDNYKAWIQLKHSEEAYQITVTNKYVQRRLEQVRNSGREVLVTLLKDGDNYQIFKVFLQV